MESYRTPRFNVSRFIVHCSCANSAVCRMKLPPWFVPSSAGPVGLRRSRTLSGTIGGGVQPSVKHTPPWTRTYTEPIGVMLYDEVPCTDPVSYSRPPNLKVWDPVL